ncbi:MAG TPA: acyl-CoA thioesterase [Bacteroidetes bacterium]|nr:acyl-CoA thioesterase [Bacteroidota bacterium]
MSEKQAQRKVDDSRTVTEILAFPADANTAGNVYGGRILFWVDMVASLVARKHCGSAVATIRTEFDFREPVRVGDHLRLEAFITATFRRSFEVQVDVCIGRNYGRPERLAGRGYLVFSCLDEAGKAREVEPISVSTEEESERRRAAEERRELRKQWRKLEP